VSLQVSEEKKEEKKEDGGGSHVNHSANDLPPEPEHLLVIVLSGCLGGDELQELLADLRQIVNSLEMGHISGDEKRRFENSPKERKEGKRVHKSAEDVGRLLHDLIQSDPSSLALVDVNEAAIPLLESQLIMLRERVQILKGGGGGGEGRGGDGMGWGAGKNEVIRVNINKSSQQ